MSNEIAESEEGRSRETAFMNRLISYPHLLENILGDLSCMTLSQAAQVSPQSKEILSTSEFWWKKWQRNTAAWSMWNMLAARLKYEEPELFRRIERRDVSAYREACNYVEQTIHHIFRCAIKSHDFYDLMFILTEAPMRFFLLALIRVDENNIYIGYPNGDIEIVNRWIKSIRNFLPSRNSDVLLHDLQFNHRLLVTMFNNGHIVVYDKEKLEQIQIINDSENNVIFHGGFCLVGDKLISLAPSRSGKWLWINIRRWDDSTAQFSSRIQKTAGIKYHVLTILRRVYSDGKLLIVDADQLKTRIIKVLDLMSLEVVRQLNCFYYPESSHYINQEYYGGVIVFENVTAEGRHYLAAWNVEEDTIEPITNHPAFIEGDRISYSAAVNHHSDYQFFIRQCNKTLELYVFHMKSRAFNKNVLKRLDSSSISNYKFVLGRANISTGLHFTAVTATGDSRGMKHFYRSFTPSCGFEKVSYRKDFFYFDGVQFIFMARGGLNIVDFDV